MDHSSLIELLNNIACEEDHNTNDFESEVFFDEDGQPTDRFLQALKQDLKTLPVSSNRSDTNCITRPTKQQSTLHHTSFHHQSKKTFTNNSSVSSDTDSNVSYDEDEDTHANVSSSTKRSKIKCRQPKEQKAKVASFCSTTNKKQLKPASIQNINILSTPSSSSVLKGKLGRKTTNKTKTENLNFKSNTVLEDSLEQDLVDKEGKVKSLQLRLKGQLETIKKLQFKLQEVSVDVKNRDKQIAQLQARLKTLVEQPIHNSNTYELRTSVQLEEKKQLTVYWKVSQYLIITRTHEILTHFSMTITT